MSRAVDAAALAAASIEQQERMVTAMGYELGTALRWKTNRMLDAALDRPRPVDQKNQSVSIPSHFEHHVHQSAADNVNLRLWNRHKIVYDIDADLWEALADNAPDDLVPTWLFSHLPHPDPFLAFPKPFILPLRDNSGQYQQVDGVFICGLQEDAHGRFMVSTMHAQSTGLTLLYVGRVYEANGTRHYVEPGHHDSIMTRITMEPRDGATLAELTATILDRFQPEPTDPAMGGPYEEDVPKLAAATVAAIMYVCAKNAELFPLPAPPVRAKGGARPKTRVKVIQVGARLGAQLRAYARSQARHEGTSGSGRTVRPHIRRGHFHTYRVGPGRQEMELKYLTPFPVNFKGDADEPTVVAVGD